MRTTILLLAAIAILAGCSSADQAEVRARMDSNAAETASYDTAAKAEGPPQTQMSTASMQAAQRKVIRNGEIGLRVDDVEKAESKVTQLVQQVGGYVANTTSSDLRGANPTMELTVRVPATEFEDTLAQLANLGHVLSKTTNSQDVTAEIVDLGARIKTLSAKEETFREMLKSNRNINDVMSLQDRLTEVRTEIERMQAQLKSISELASLSTIKINLSRSESVPATVADTDPNWFGQTLGSATTSFMGVARTVVGAATWLVVFSPFWLLPVLFAWWLWRRYGKKLVTG
jgi:hypothetical protein